MCLFCLLLVQNIEKNNRTFAVLLFLGGKMEDIYKNIISSIYDEDEVWVRFASNNNFIPWKIHIYADKENELKEILRLILPALILTSTNHKFLKPSVIEAINQIKQKGKALVIYPSSKEVFRFMALKFDALLSAKFPAQNKHIIGDNQIGNSGRIFYHYDLDSGIYKDIEFNLLNKDLMKLYDKHYEPNRGGKNYLADDMTEKDDIFFIGETK